MFDVAVSQLTTPRWELREELDHVVRHGFSALAVWRPKLSDTTVAEAAVELAKAGVRVSSLQWAGGFTGGDGRSFAESLDDARDAVAAAARLACPVLVLHSGCRGGHTRSHASRLLFAAIELLLPAAESAGVRLAIKPVHPAAAPGASFLSSLEEAVEIVTRFAHPSLALACDLWHFGDHVEVADWADRIARHAAVVQAADRIGPPSPEADRLPVGHGRLPLEQWVAELVAHGYRGTIEIDPVGEAVETLGYDAVLRQSRGIAAGWAESAAGVQRSHSAAAHLRPAGTGSRRSQASSQVVSPG